MKPTKEILDQIPSGCKLNWNGKMNRFYVYKPTYVYNKKTKRTDTKRESVGVVIDGVFSYSSNQLLQKELQSLKGSKSDKPEATEEGRKTCAVAAGTIPDKRQQGKVEYPISYVYLVSVLCALTGHTSCVQIADYWKNHRTELESVFDDFPKKDISHDTVRRLLMLMDPQSVSGFYTAFIRPFLQHFSLRVVAVDGQAATATKTDRIKTGLFLLSFYDTDNGVALGQKLIGEKENEITHCASMVERFDLSGCVVTADALNTQSDFAQALIGRKADYCLAVKGNHKFLYDDIQMCFLDRTETQTITVAETNLGHGRIETRRISVLPGRRLESKHLEKWVGLEEGAIIKATTETVNKNNGSISSPDRYFITSLRWDNRLIAEQCARAVRRHWGIENDLHYVLDVDFYQDRTQCKNANYLFNRTLFNKLALAVIRQLQILEEKETGKEPMSVRRYQAKNCSPIAALTSLSKVRTLKFHA